MEKKFRFENLIVYREALIFVKLIYDISEKWPMTEQFGLTQQFRRAATSIVLNIAEGSSRTSKDFKHFLSLSRGSCFECVAILQIAKERGYISEENYDLLYDHVYKLSKMLSSLRTKLTK